MRVQIEMDDTRPNSAGYGQVHKAGCSDLRDGMDLVTGSDVDLTSDAQLVEALEWIGWDGYTSDEAHTLLAPCARGAFKA